MAKLKIIIDSHSNPVKMLEIHNTTLMQDFLNSLEDFLTQFRRCKGVPLIYLIRKNLTPLPEVNDPRTNYTTLQGEMSKREPYKGLSYSTDNQKFATILKTITRKNTNSQTLAKQEIHNLNSCSIILVWIQHYQGTVQIKTQQIVAENNIKNLQYYMKTYKFNFEKYTTLHRHYYNEINSINKALILQLPEILEHVKV